MSKVDLQMASTRGILVILQVGAMAVAGSEAAGVDQLALAALPVTVAMPRRSSLISATT